MNSSEELMIALPMVVLCVHCLGARFEMAALEFVLIQLN